jgi:hypothetical protein
MKLIIAPSFTCLFGKASLIQLLSNVGGINELKKPKFLLPLSCCNKL